MGRITHGNSGLYQIQPNRTVAIKNDGTMEGQVILKGDAGGVGAWPQIGAVHPDDYRLEMYQANITYGNNGEATLTGSFFGLTNSPSPKQISYSGGQNNDPIESHPDFEDFAGTGDAPKNGAVWEPQMGDPNAENVDDDGFVLDANGEKVWKFLYFSIKPFLGTEYYLTPSTMVSVSYWTDRAPSLKRRMTIQKSVSGFRSPPDVADYLLLDTPYRQVGNFYQVTEQYLGSGKKGWNPKVYKK